MDILAVMEQFGVPVAMTRPRFQEVGRYYRQIDRPTKKSTNGTNKT